MSLCNLCPRHCNTDRGTQEGLKRSLCRAPRTVEIALVSLHRWEEPCISGSRGAGTVFFSHCNMRCCFCQNYQISAQGWGRPVTLERLTEIFLEQQERRASCLELVTPGQYTEEIAFCLQEARKQGLTIPVAYNSNGYELPETLEKLRGLVDIFMPDLKYFDSRLGEKYSGVPHYFEYASKAIKKMFELVGPAQFAADGLMKKGLIVRHLILPWQWRDSCKCLDWLHETFGNDIYVSIMNQYTPCWKANRHPEINRRLTTLEYQKVEQHAEKIGLVNAFVQVGKTSLTKFIPIFDGTNVEQASDLHSGNAARPLMQAQLGAIVS